jgi:cytochrome c oxidase subunit IV
MAERTTGGHAAGERSGAELRETAHAEHAHPDWKFYSMIGLALAVLTALEVAVIYVPALEPIEVPLVLGISLVKFVLVVLFFMHLRFDSPLFSWVFVAQLLLASLVIVSLIILFKVLPLFDPMR